VRDKGIQIWATEIAAFKAAVAEACAAIEAKL